MPEAKIGCILSLSGLYAPWGEAFSKGWKMQIEKFNSRGDIFVGSEKLIIEFMVEDDQSDPAVAKKSVEKLLDKGAQFFIGAISADVALAAQEVTEPNRVLFLCISYTEEALGPKKPFTLRPLPSSTERYPVLWKWLAKAHPKEKKVSIISPKDKVGENLSVVSKKSSSREGFEIVGEFMYTHSTLDFTPLLQDILGANPDIVDFAGSPTKEVGQIIKRARELGYKGLFTTTSGHSTKVLCEIGGKENVEGFIHSTMVYDGPLATEQMKEYKREYLTRWGVFDEVSGRAINYIPMLVQGINEAQSLKSTQVRDAILGMKSKPTGGIEGYWAGERTYGIGHQYYSKIYICKLDSGNNVAVAHMNSEELL